MMDCNKRGKLRVICRFQMKYKLLFIEIVAGKAIRFERASGSLSFVAVRKRKPGVGMGKATDSRPSLNTIFGVLSNFKSAIK
jgi:hypothetical protein